jgi:ribosomal protein S18 acetylase RimI-like enzyme
MPGVGPAERATGDDFAHITACLADFWGPRTPPWHHPIFMHEFGDGALVVRDGDRRVAGYLLGMLHTDRHVAYVHIVAVRQEHRGEGIATALYDRFEQLGRARGCVAIKAITRPDNELSIAFHQARGMTAELVEDYSGPGESRIVLRKPL